MNLSTTAWAWVALIVALGFFLLTHFGSRSTFLAVCGVGTVFLSVPLAFFFSFLTTSYAQPEVVEAWLFSFRFLGVSLFVWGMCDGIGQRIDNLSRALNLKSDDRTPR